MDEPDATKPDGRSQMLESDGAQAMFSFHEPSHAAFFDEMPTLRIKPAVADSMLCRTGYLIVAARFAHKSSIIAPWRHQIRIRIAAVWAVSFNWIISILGECHIILPSSCLRLACFPTSFRVQSNTQEPTIILRSEDIRSWNRRIEVSV
jgi:hypothetical protein